LRNARRIKNKVGDKKSREGEYDQSLFGDIPVEAPTVQLICTSKNGKNPISHLSLKVIGIVNWKRQNAHP
jgi:hypothetical protein